MKAKIMISVAMSALALLGNGNAQAQEREYKPILTEGKEWVYEYYSYNTSVNLNSKYIITVKGDTVFDGQPAKILNIVNEYVDNSDSDNPETRRTEKNKVMMEKNGVVWDTDSLIYVDMNLNLGDEYWPYMNYEYDENYPERLPVVEYEDEYDTSIGKLKRIIFHENEKTSFAMVEGIGCSDSSLSLLATTGVSLKMTVCRLNGEVIFTEKDFRRNAAGVKGLPGDDEETSVKTGYSPSAAAFDLWGRQVKNAAKGSILIQNGRKVIVR